MLLHQETDDGTAGSALASPLPVQGSSTTASSRASTEPPSPFVVPLSPQPTHHHHKHHHNHDSNETLRTPSPTAAAAEPSPSVPRVSMTTAESPTESPEPRRLRHGSSLFSFRRFSRWFAEGGPDPQQQPQTGPDARSPVSDGVPSPRSRSPPRLARARQHSASDMRAAATAAAGALRSTPTLPLFLDDQVREHETGTWGSSGNNAPELCETLGDPDLAQAFCLYLVGAQADESMRFLLHAERIAHAATAGEQRALARAVYAEFLRPGAPSELNLAEATRSAVAAALERDAEEDDAHSDVGALHAAFAVAQRQIYSLLAVSHHPAWLATGAWRTLAPRRSAAADAIARGATPSFVETLHHRGLLRAFNLYILAHASEWPRSSNSGPSASPSECLAFCVEAQWFLSSSTSFGGNSDTVRAGFQAPAGLEVPTPAWLQQRPSVRAMETAALDVLARYPRVLPMQHMPETPTARAAKTDAVDVVRALFDTCKHALEDVYHGRWARGRAWYRELCRRAPCPSTPPSLDSVLDAAAVRPRDAHHAALAAYVCWTGNREAAHQLAFLVRLRALEHSDPFSSSKGVRALYREYVAVDAPRRLAVPPALAADVHHCFELGQSSPSVTGTPAVFVQLARFVKESFAASFYAAWLRLGTWVLLGPLKNEEEEEEEPSVTIESLVLVAPFARHRVEGDSDSAAPSASATQCAECGAISTAALSSFSCDSRLSSSPSPAPTPPPTQMHE